VFHARLDEAVWIRVVHPQYVPLTKSLPAASVKDEAETLYLDPLQD
jgi:hypothetical protein